MDLIRYARGDVRPPRDRRVIASEGKAIVEEVELAALMARGAFELAEDIMDGVTELDAYRRFVGGNDATLQMILAKVESTAVFQADRIQRRLYNKWGS